MFRRLTTLLISILLLVGFATPAFAEKPDDSGVSNIPEVSGDYPDPDHPGLRVRVYVHPESGQINHPAKPSPTSSPALVCTENPNSEAFVSGGLHLPATNWTYKLNTSSVPATVGGSNLPAIATNGFSQWTNAISSSTSKPNLVYGGSTTINRATYDGQNIIAWGRTSGTVLGVTTLWYYPDTGLIAETDVIMNNNKKLVKWAWSQGSMCADDKSYDAQNILTHELGHVFGLDDEYESPFVDNTMFGYGSKGETKKNIITNGDSLGIQAIYP